MIRFSYSAGEELSWEINLKKRERGGEWNNVNLYRWAWEFIFMETLITRYINYQETPE